MKFEPLAHVFAPDANSDWMFSHASNPVAMPLGGDVFRIYFSCRDQAKRSHVAYVDYDVVGKKIESLSPRPLLSPGSSGCFDDSGTTVGCVVRDDEGKLRLYYMAWNLTGTVPFRNAIGLAVEDQCGNFEKISGNPIVGFSEIDPLSLSYPWVLKKNNVWRMWYGSHDAWSTGRFEMLHFIRVAESSDGLSFSARQKISLPAGEDEFGFSRPCVVFENGIYKMWFSVRGGKYSIGYAESEDGVNWHRTAVHIGGSGQGWDSDARCYATIFDHDSTRYMLYCGNDYGRTGFGLAALV